MTTTMATTNTIKKSSSRLWEIDTFRGIAIVLMVIYHFTWDLNHFGIVRIENFLTGSWQIFARSIATMFIFIMGVSLTLSYQREVKQSGQSRLFTKYLIRGLKILGWGLVITVATYFFIGQGFVVFGILHLLGTSIILAYPFLGFNRWLNLATGLGVIAIGYFIDPIRIESPWFIWFGFRQAGRPMVDFYPLFPWFGIALLGLFGGASLYPHGQHRFDLPDLGDILPIYTLRFLGRHSLLIYLIHQPILIGILLALGYN